jgi:hypothetical protein
MCRLWKCMAHLSIVACLELGMIFIIQHSKQIFCQIFYFFLFQDQKFRFY